MWEKRAKEAWTYGSDVDWKERYYLCPECGEAIYDGDWSEEYLHNFICPICGFKGEEDEEEKEFKVIVNVTYTVSAKNEEQAKEFASEMFMNKVTNWDYFDVDIVE